MECLVSCQMFATSNVVNMNKSHPVYHSFFDEVLVLPKLLLAILFPFML